MEATRDSAGVGGVLLSWAKRSMPLAIPGSEAADTVPYQDSNKQTFPRAELYAAACALRYLSELRFPRMHLFLFIRTMLPLSMEPRPHGIFVWALLIPSYEIFWDVFDRFCSVVFRKTKGHASPDEVARGVSTVRQHRGYIYMRTAWRRLGHFR